jgi:hypothetical protein
MKKLVLAMFVVLSLVSFKNSFSQITGSITAKGTVLAPISIISSTDLNFGTSILPGVPVTVDKSAGSGAGTFVLSGVANKQINVTLTLPSNLQSGVNTMPISFTSTDGGYKTPGGTMGSFNPANSVTPSFANEGLITIYLGGKVSPAHTQVAGAYTAQVQLSVFYTGN